MSTTQIRKPQQTLRMPLRKCILRCDKYLRLLVGGTYGYTRIIDGGVRKFHGGVDLYAKQGAPCFAMFNGRVEWSNDFGDVGWGKAVLTRLDFPQSTCWALYAHLSKVFVHGGTPLEPGTLIGLTGITGNGDSDYPHLHLEMWRSLDAGKPGTREKYRFDPLHVLGPLPLQPFAVDVIEKSTTANRTA
jgi:murein DD-endopeptidase MepM/ murein hydrolase activator NlpD